MPVEPLLRTLDGTRLDELVKLSCGQKAAMEMLLWETEEAFTVRGNLLRVVRDGGGRHLIAESVSDYPLENKTVEGTRVEVVFQYRGERYAFLSLVKGCGSAQRREGRFVHVLILKYPETLENRQRRANYRVPLDSGPAVTVCFREANVVGPFRDGPLYSGLVCDISGGGIGILTHQVLDQTIEPGTMLRMWFQLPDIREHLGIDGVIRNSRPNESEEGEPVQGAILGVEFISPNSGGERSPDARNRDLIRRFVVARQREILKKLRLI
jgi:c-di-GMP-binding flagellar brake protein YcgR